MDDLDSSGMASILAEDFWREQMPWGWIQVVASNSLGLSSKVIHLVADEESKGKEGEGDDGGENVGGSAGGGSAGCGRSM